MVVWLKREQGQLVTWQQVVALTEGDRIVVYDPAEDNELIKCSKAFFSAEIARGRIRYASQS